ncbi:B-box zinc finger protein 20-like isoform X1 [Musa acuminata AAA Group]|uniref:B-box zinc finger protein 20-like isoform X1 n=1 Tax=Musa acuminata AAA Group TaxID=214697 RepID=UPI0031DB266A
MKVQCDVCAAEAAEVYCCADEAALCGRCDRHVHRANRLAGKHHRFSLLHPSSSAQSPPLCDVCKVGLWPLTTRSLWSLCLREIQELNHLPCFLKEKRGLLFCQEDRAILCRDCDVPIHSATALTMKHNRFLLTGLSVSAAPLPPSLSAEAEAVDCPRGSGVRAKSSSSSSSATTAATTNSNSSSISEYLIKMLPGWHVEDFLTDDAAVHALCKTEEEEEVEPPCGSNAIGGALPVPRVPHWFSGGEGIGLEQVELKASSRNKRPRISVRYL